MLGSTALFIGLAALGWGGLGALLAHPARAAGCLVVALSAVAAMFADLDLSRGSAGVARYRWAFVLVVPLALAWVWLPAYADRHDFATLDGDAVRYLGVFLIAVGVVLRVGPMFVLGRRFGLPLAPQEEHRLVTSGFYRFVRHPSYLGALVGGAGWVLIFRSGIGLLLAALLVPAGIPLIRAEERRLEAEFGEEYAAYRRRTWRLLPFVY
jgi:protein-S-isoprenylcysteine O-methyltransferase Ste14